MNRKYTTALLLIVCLHSLLAQEQPGNRKKAGEYFTGYEYGKATLLYQKLVDTKNPRLEDMERLAFSSYQINDYELASNWYARVVEDAESAPENLLMYARALKQTMRYHEAKQVFERYRALTGKEEEVALDLAGCEKAIKWLASPSAYALKNEENINTPLSEFGAFPLDDTVYFSGESSSGSKRYSWTGNSFLRVFSATKLDSTLGNPLLFKPFNKENKYHIGPVGSNKAGDTFFVTQTHVGRQGDLSKIGNRKYQTNRLELILYTKDAKGEWIPTPFAYNNVEEYSVGHAALSVDEQVLYFISDMPGSLGGTDIWFSERSPDGSWGKPQNAGKEINSALNELFPNMAPDGTLYYSSNGFAGMGGLDVYKSKGGKSVWASPENLRYPVNSSGDDFAFVVSHIEKGQLKGYMSSNRPMGQGGDDIYSFTYPSKPMVLILEGMAYAGQGEKIQLPEVSISLKETDQTLIAKKLSDGSGAFTFGIEPDRDYTLLGQKERFYSDSLVFSTKGLSQSDTVRVALHLEPLFQIGKKFVLQDIHYDFDKYAIRKDATDILNELMRIMRNNPTLKIELSSHTDSRGSARYNMTLSHKRAESVVDFLVSRGIARDRMTAKGHGETQLLNPCSDGIECSEQEHQQNRRTEVRVLAF